MSTQHILKTVEPYFSAVLSGEKTFEVRRNDRAFQKGDVLVLLDSAGCGCDNLGCVQRRAPIYKVVTFVFSGDPSLRDNGGIMPGMVVLGLGETGTDS